MTNKDLPVANPNGRPTVMTPETLERLRSAFAIGCTKKEACAYAKIGKSTLYDYINQNPEFSDEIEELIQTPILKAKQTVTKNLDDLETAKWYLQRKKKDEFANTLVDIKQDNRSVQIVKNDPRVINTLMKSFESMMENIKKLPDDEES